MQQKGFTLIELLVVIAIIAILSVVVILTLNPAELLRQARDSNRVSDLNTLKSAISLYLADVSPVTLGAAGTCYMSATSSLDNCGFTGTYATRIATTSQAVDGSGWLPVNLTNISSGAPVGNLPIDPLNTSPNVYRYVANTTSSTFELNADMESTKYTADTTGLEDTDGGNDTNLYETGTASGLSL